MGYISLAILNSLRNLVCHKWNDYPKIMIWKTFHFIQLIQLWVI